ncbi:efflux RND transporter periplasmic adaptor subunit [Marinomonas sp. IMCC 4694]|uniref:efflux RND transporter periplasmic adaptor subunit n=1 Tax=Marinomonas sp. IMCC 4694 TaxID=2605432 RepID=UPI0011E678E3|nr:efflux RND transporter periplasmic adaptor subunit [Marinomonas sp. IMCC 4694]TYL45823.1 efflux RND transporter periplasmic adaptor subunit [Marinomonas sp. IMCC 4694]
MAAVNINEFISRLRALRKRNFHSSPEVFWADFVNIAEVLCLAEGAHVFAITGTGKVALQAEVVAAEDSLGHPVSPLALPTECEWLPELVVRSVQNGFAAHHDKVPLQAKPHWLCFRLTTQQPRVLLLKIAEENHTRLGDIVLRAQLIADIANDRPETRSDSNNDSNDALSLLSIMPEIYAATPLALSAYALVNSLVSQCNDIDLAAIGWQKGEYIRIECISHFDRFEEKADLVKLYEAALEEAADQHSVLHLSHSSTTDGMIVLAHEQLRRELGCDDLATLVIFGNEGQPIGSVLIVKMKGLIDTGVVHSLTFMLSLLSSRFDDLKVKEDGLWKRFKRRTGRILETLVGPEWLWTKVATVVLSSAMLWLVFGSLSFRVESNGEFLTDRTQLINASQDGLVIDVLATVGDSVERSQTLLTLEKQDLLLQLTELAAERQRYASEEDKARASNDIIETEIAKARGAQIEARSTRVQRMLEETNITSPFAGVIIKGERKDLLGAPIRKGDALMTVARIEDIYLQLLVDERDIHFIELGDRGEFALVSQPLSPLAFEVEKIIPIAVDGGQKGATFQIKAKLLEAPQNWWRPGMTGVAKVDKGDAAPYWILGRKSYNQLRLLLWW